MHLLDSVKQHGERRTESLVPSQLLAKHAPANLELARFAELAIVLHKVTINQRGGHAVD